MSPFGNDKSDRRRRENIQRFQESRLAAFREEVRYQQLTKESLAPHFFDTSYFVPEDDRNQPPSVVPRLWISEGNGPLTKSAIPVWIPPLASGPFASFHTDQYRWVKVLAYLEAKDSGAGASPQENIHFVDVPLTDNDYMPYVDPAIPPKVILRRATASNDWTTSHLTKIWTDELTNQRPLLDLVSGIHSWYTLRVEKDPKPHWVLRLQVAQHNTSPMDYTLMADVYGGGFGEHDATEVEVGSLNTPGHHIRTLCWSQVGFNEDPDKGAADERCFASGKFFLRKASSPGTFYLHSPNGESGDTVIFSQDYMPGVQCFRGYYGTGSPERNSDPQDADETLWMYGSAGYGLNTGASPPFSSASTYTAHHSTLEDGNVGITGTADYQLKITNDTSAGGQPSGGEDAPYFPFAIGKKAGS